MQNLVKKGNVSISFENLNILTICVVWRTICHCAKFRQNRPNSFGDIAFFDF